MSSLIPRARERAGASLARNETRGVLAGDVVAVWCSLPRSSAWQELARSKHSNSLRPPCPRPAALPTARFLASAAVGSAVTVLARLLLTLMGLSLGSDSGSESRPGLTHDPSGYSRETSLNRHLAG
jgi:hypothetical protein